MTEPITLMGLTAEEIRDQTAEQIVDFLRDMVFLGYNRQSGYGIERDDVGMYLSLSQQITESRTEPIDDEDNLSTETYLGDAILFKDIMTPSGRSWSESDNHGLDHAKRLFTELGLDYWG